MEEAVSIFHSVVGVEQQNGGPQQKKTLAENKNPASRSNYKQRVDKVVKRQKGVENHPTAVGLDTGEGVCGKNLTE